MSSLKYTTEDKIALLHAYINSGLSISKYSKSVGMSPHTLKSWLEAYTSTKLTDVNSPTDIEMSNDINELKAELAKLRKEKTRLQRELDRANLRADAFSTLVDLAESTFHISIKKTSVPSNQALVTG